MGELRKVIRSMCEGAVSIHNVRHAVFGLDGKNSELSGPVESYSDRGVVFPVELFLRKAPNSEAEQVILEKQDRILKKHGVGAKEIMDVYSLNGGTEGLIERLTDLRIQNFLSRKRIKFFINSKSAIDFSEQSGLEVFGPNCNDTERINNKIFQRRMVQRKNENIFPRHYIVKDFLEIEDCFASLAATGEVLAKVGHLASGEGFRIVNNNIEAAIFWYYWRDILAKNGIEKAIILEQKMPLRKNHYSASAQYYRSGGKNIFLGSSLQHMGKNIFDHEGNMAGSDIYSFLSPEAENEMRIKAEFMLSLPEMQTASGIIGFDFIICDNGPYFNLENDILLTEINLRITASSYLFALMAQLGEDLSYDLQKIHLKKEAGFDIGKLMNYCLTSNEIIIPLNPRCLIEHDQMFVALVARNFCEIDKIKKKVMNDFPLYFSK